MTAPPNREVLSSVPLRDLPDDVTADLEELGGRPINLYRALANSPDMLRAYLKLAWGLRRDAGTSRGLRELVILRAAQVAGSAYQWSLHLPMARDAGVPQEQIAALGRWRETNLFSEAERSALTLSEAVTRGRVDQETADELKRHFDESERVELILTASFYAMVARLIDAMGVPPESEWNNVGGLTDTGADAV